MKAGVKNHILMQESPMNLRSPRPMKMYGRLGVWGYGRRNAHTPTRPHVHTFSQGDSRLLHLIITVGVPGLLIGLALWHVPSESAWTICGFRNLTGLPCPGCGTTRGLSALLHRNLLQAFQFNPLAFPALLTLVVWWFWSLCVLARWQSAAVRIEAVFNWRHHRALTWSLLVAVGVFWIGRLWLYLAAQGFLAAVQEGWLFRLFRQVVA